jgi:5-methylcytosine-specific restriction protein A
MCLSRGVATVATVTDHIEPHGGDWNAFWMGKTQSLCKSCHDGRKRVSERRGYQLDIGEDGWPIDPAHPAYHGRGR